MPAYEAGDFDPPAPVARARVVGPAGASQSNVPFLLDSGADVSVVPLSIAQAVGAVVDPAQVLVRYLDGDATPYDRATLSIELGRYRFAGPFLVARTDYGVFGRNVLNLIVLTLDGPSLIWTA